MKTYTCDICGCKISGNVFQVHAPDGEHPHNGSMMYTDLDTCLNCLLHLKLETREDLEEIKKRLLP